MGQDQVSGGVSVLLLKNSQQFDILEKNTLGEDYILYL